MTTVTYSVKRKADRAAMAECLAKIWRDVGGTVTITPEGAAWHNKRRVRVDIRLGDHAAWVEFDGATRSAETYVVPWHAAKPTDKLLTWNFGHTAGGPVNHQKCTAVCRGFDDLCERCKAAAELLANGRAFG